MEYKIHKLIGANSNQNNENEERIRITPHISKPITNLQGEKIRSKKQQDISFFSKS